MVSRLAFLVLLLVGIVLSPLRAAAATVPMLVAYDGAVPHTATMALGGYEALRSDAERSPFKDYECTRVGYGNPSNPPVVVGAGLVHAYDDARELLERRELAKGAIYGAVAATIAAEAATTIDTSLVRFTQSSVGQTLRTGENINDVVQALKGPGGDTLAKGFEPIRIFQNGAGDLATLDNRRLLIFSQAGREVPFVWASPADVAAESWKFSATPQQTGGWFIRVK